MPLPVIEADQIVRPHQPAEPVPRAAPAELCQRLKGCRCSEFRFRRDHPDMASAGNKMACAIQPGAQPGHAADRLQRVLRADQPPDFIKAQLAAGQIGKMKMAFMGRVEGSAKQPDTEPPAVMEEAWNAVPAKMIRFSRHEAAHRP